LVGGLPLILEIGFDVFAVDLGVSHTLANDFDGQVAIGGLLLHCSAASQHRERYQACRKVPPFHEELPTPRAWLWLKVLKSGSLIGKGHLMRTP
jgi:hypothetical protein